MTTSSVQQDFSVTLTDEQLAALTTFDTLTMSTSNCYTTSGTITLPDYASCHTITTSSTYPTISFTGGAVGASTTATYSVGSGVSSIDFSNYSFPIPAEFVNCFPEWSRIEKMCEAYPGLKIAFEKFKTTYSLVKDDYDAPKDKRVKP